jgi:uncharacterized protein YdaT
MKWNDDGTQESMAGLDYLVRAKAFELFNAQDGNETPGEDEMLTQSIEEAQGWYETASEEEKEELRKRYPEDKLEKD